MLMLFVLGRAAALALSAPMLPVMSAQFALPSVDPAVAPMLAPGRRYRNVQISGNTVVPTRDLESIAEPYLERFLVGAEVESLRQSLTRHYVSRGFVNSGVLLKNESAAGESLEFSVVEGRVGKIHLVGLDRLAAGYLVQRLASTDEVLNLNVLQDRMQLLLSDPMIERLHARVEPGDSRGLADIHVEVREAARHRMSAFVSNHQSPSTGRLVRGVQGEILNLTGWGDSLRLMLQGSDGQDGYSIGWEAPVNARGTALNLAGYASSASVIEEPLRTLDIGSRSEGWEIGLSHPLLQSPDRRFVLSLAYSDRESRTLLGGLPFAFAPGAADGSTRIREWRFAQEYIRRTENAAVALRSTFACGANNAAASPDPASSPSQHYRTWIGQAQAALSVLSRGEARFRGSLQWSSGSLVSMAQFAVGGAATVRGYGENQLVRDRGWNASIEYRHPLRRDDEQEFMLSLSPFLDYGEAWNAGQRSDALSSSGLSIAMSYGALDAELALAQRISRRTARTSSALQDRGIHFQVRYRFF